MRALFLAAIALLIAGCDPYRTFTLRVESAVPPPTRVTGLFNQGWAPLRAKQEGDTVVCMCQGIVPVPKLLRIEDDGHAHQLALVRDGKKWAFDLENVPDASFPLSITRSYAFGLFGRDTLVVVDLQRLREKASAGRPGE